jgi:CRISPR/Cas system-associated endonuclease/helicase Cas3
MAWKSFTRKKNNMKKSWYRVYTNAGIIGLEYFDFDSLWRAKAYKNWIRQGHIKKITAKTHHSKC